MLFLSCYCTIIIVQFCEKYTILMLHTISHVDQSYFSFGVIRENKRVMEILLMLIKINIKIEPKGRT